MMVDGEPYIIDFQGGRRGPIYYDVASFVWQARSCFPDALRQELIQTYLRALRNFREVDEARFMERLRLFVLFRTLQVLGTVTISSVQFSHSVVQLFAIPWTAAHQACLSITNS